MAIVGCAVGIGFLPPVQHFAQNVIRIATNKGVLEIETDDADLEITVKQAGKIAVAELVNKQTKKVYELSAVDGEIEVTERGPAGIGVKSKTPFHLTRGGRVVLTARLLLANAPRDSGTSLPRPEPGWVQLFNGKDLAGWKTHPSQPGDWRVEKGVLVGRGPKASHLFSERADFRDFQLRVETKLTEKGKSSVYVRSPFSLPFRVGKTGVPRGFAAVFQGDGASVLAGQLSELGATSGTSRC